MRNKKLVIIPTYNEKENAEAIIRKVFSLNQNFDILIVDDSSPDGTGEIVRTLSREFSGLHLLERKGKLGLGTAYLAGFKYAIDEGYDYIFEMDADFSHNPDDLDQLYQACIKGADVAIGSRYKSGVNVINWPIGRVIMSYYASAYVRFVTRMKIMDTTAGFVCYRREALSAIDFDRIKMKGYGFQIEMKYTSWRLGFKVDEVPIIFIDRKRGSSKMSSGIFGEAMWGVFRLRFRKIRKKQSL
ncbi:MAG: polyprenol monophosphomannose synthase [Prevotellaceae bacterium]|jgi:dolichol-phosphate mannosyltransferase|nr:polyprenol monophosphomannose synthase [Prevotellaceae bacterium]